MSESADRSAEPLLVAIDAATSSPSLAMLAGERPLAVRSMPAGERTDAWLPGALDECLAEAGRVLDEVEGLAVTIGPGAFTGIRVGLALALGLAAPRRLPVRGVLTLEALAESGRRRCRWLAPCIDARRGQVYGAAYELDGRLAAPLAPALPPAAYRPSELARLLGGLGIRPLLIGSGAALVDAPPGCERLADPGPLAPAAGALLARGWSAGPEACGHEPLPVYLRPADARPPRNPLLAARRGDEGGRGGGRRRGGGD